MTSQVKMSNEVHMNENRSLTNALIGFSESCKHEDESNFKSAVNDSWNEAVTPWKTIISHPRYYPYQVSLVIKRKQKPVDCRIQDWQRASDGEAKQAVRCVNDALENGPYLHWKGMVEQVTYRYVPHNGYYRTMKFLNLDKRDWFTVHKKQPEQVSMSWQSKRYQKELKRQLKKDFENSSKQEIEKDCVSQGIEIRRELTTIELAEEKALQRSRLRAKSTRPSDTPKRHQKDEDGYMVPEIKSAPLPGDFYKSRSDLYIENISLRINALEQEIANDSRLKKTQDESVKPLFRPKVRERGNITPRPYKKESLPDDVFTAKSVGVVRDSKSQDKMSPVTRGTPNDDSKTAPVTHFGYTTASTVDNTVNLPTIDLEKTLNSYKMAIETTRQSLFTTLSGKQITRRTIASKNYNAPTTITICDNGEGTDKGSIQEYIRPLRGEKRIRDKKEAVGVTSLLPGIAGKRLEVPTTTHRWL